MWPESRGREKPQRVLAMCSLSKERETKFRTLPALKVIVSAACDKITVSHIKHFKTETP
jgi:hypothetical protein